MNTLNKILKKITPIKTDLASEKVNLNIVSKLKERKKQLEKGKDELMMFATNAREAIAFGVKEMNRVDAVYSLSKKLLSVAEAKAKKLGVEIEEAKRLKQAINGYEQLKKSLIKILK